ncbi:MAG: transporter substrate-binding domain-containing protein [Archangium sp.]|nr:transporter substrate-binding domain-containing protein [Archangium sp.]
MLATAALVLLTAVPLKVLVRAGNDDFLPPQADPARFELQVLEAFAKAQGRAVELVPIDSFAELIPSLLAGRGDVIAAGLTITDTRKKQVTFTRPTQAVDEVLVGRRGAVNPPKTVKDLAGRTVVVPKGSSFVETLAAIPGVTVVEKENLAAADQLPFELARGAFELTVVDSLRLEAMKAYLPELDPRFPLVQGRGLGFALRPADQALRSRLDAFLIENSFRAGVSEDVTDLPEIKKRGTLRVLTRNNAVSFYLYKGNRDGFDYELAKGFARSLGLTLEVIIAPSYDALIPMLKAGKGDFIAASLTATPERAKDVDFTRPYLFVKEQVVQQKGKPPLTSLDQLRGRVVTVRRSSSYAERLRPLAAQHGFTLADADEESEVEDLLADVDEGVIDLTVADSHFFQAEALFRKELEAPLELTGEAPIAFAVRKENPKLKAALDAWVKRVYRGTEYNMLKKRCFENKGALKDARELATNKTGRISQFDPLIQKYSQQYGFDWRLMSAQAWRESRFDPKAVSFAGALGLFQVMPATGQELGFTKLKEAEQGTHAGIKYMSQLVRRVEPSIPLAERVRFALAGYNAGFGRVQDARRLAAELKLDPDVWAGNVEKAMGLMARPKYARRVRTGFCRCQEPVDYVRVIENKYESFVQIVP